MLADSSKSKSCPNLVQLDVDSWWQTNIVCNDRSVYKTTLGLIIEKDEEHMLSNESLTKDINKEQDLI